MLIIKYIINFIYIIQYIILLKNMEKKSIWSKLTDFMSWFRSLFFNKELEISILGLQNAGKSTFVDVLANGKFDDDKIPTIGFNYKRLVKGKVEFKLWDLGGQPRFRESWEKYCRTANCIIYVVDSADIGNIDVSKKQLHQLLSSSSLEGISLLVLGNKNDLDGALNEEKLADLMDLNIIKDRTVAIYSISCKNMNNIENVFKWLQKLKSK